MSKNIKDYLHLYLGCEVLTDKGVGHLISAGLLGSTGQCFRTIMPGMSISKEWEESNKPILRPLSSMTEEEKIDIFQVGESDWRQRHHEFNSDQFIKLLSKGFDLFGLIESGIAIDKTKNVI